LLVVPSVHVVIIAVGRTAASRRGRRRALRGRAIGFGLFKRGALAL
jgi:hypothetical protein